MSLAVREAREVTSLEPAPWDEKTGNVSRWWREELDAREESRSSVDW